MKKSEISRAIVLVLAAAAMLPATLSAQKVYHRSAGFQLQQLGGDFGLGLHTALPVYKNAVFLHVSGGWNWLEHFSPAENEATWTSYQNLRAGLGGRYPVTTGVTCYSEGGVMLVRLDDKLSDRRNGVGGYGLFGFEFMFAQRAGYFIELGGSGVNAEAGRVAGRPLVANGFMISTGYRMKF